MRVRDLVDRLGGEVVSQYGDMAYEPSCVTNDSRKIIPGGLFACVKGFVADGHDFAGAAVANGASVLVSERPAGGLGLPADVLKKTSAFVQVADSRHALAAASHLFYGDPTRRIKLAGVTGTKGKTTVVYMIRAILRAAGQKPGMLGTIENDIGGEIRAAGETTPESVDLAAYFAKMAERGCASAAMEVSSQGLALSRVGYCDFDVGVFTNFYNDHISPHEHANIEDYFAAKLKLFSMCRDAVVNADMGEYAAVRAAFEGSRACRGGGSGSCGGDDYYGGGSNAVGCGSEGSRGRSGGSSGSGRFLSYSADEGGLNHHEADIRASRIELIGGGRAHTRFCVETPWFSDTLTVGMPGRYNISNALAAIAVCGLFGASKEAIREGLRDIAVRGRTQPVGAGGKFSVMVDYAHNAASLESLLKMLRGYDYKRIITVFGCGGNRARDRRFYMGEASGRYSDLTVVTSDNPRKEDPAMIMADIETGLMRTGGKYVSIADRKEAIGYAIGAASDGDLVLIAGKGHEASQEFANVTIPFDDVEVAENILRGTGAKL